MAPCTGGCSANRWTRAPAHRRSFSAYTFWHNRLGAKPNLIGSTVYIDRKPVTIAGVAQPAFPGLDFNVPDMFVPITQREYFYPESTMLRAWNEGTVDMYAPAPGRRVARRGARGAALDHAGDRRRTARRQERRMAGAVAGHATTSCGPASGSPCWPSSR